MIFIILIYLNGDLEAIRTLDLRLRRPLLYPAELQGQRDYSSTLRNKNKYFFKKNKNKSANLSRT